MSTLLLYNSLDVKEKKAISHSETLYFLSLTIKLELSKDMIKIPLHLLSFLGTAVILKYSGLQFVKGSALNCTVGDDS